MARIAVVDGCAADRDKLCRVLAAQPLVHTVVECASEEELQAAGKFDVVFLALAWEGRELGVEIALRLNDAQPDCAVVFCTAFPELSPEAYCARHVCLVTKDRLEELVPRALALAAANGHGLRVPHPFVAPYRGGVRIIEQERVLYVERRGRASFFYLMDGEVVSTPKKLSELLADIGEGRFVRCHASYMVNMDEVAEMRRQIFELKNGIQVPISRSYQPAVREAFDEYMTNTERDEDEDAEGRSCARGRRMVE